MKPGDKVRVMTSDGHFYTAVILEPESIQVSATKGIPAAINFNEPVGPQIRTLRKTKKLTQKMLAARASITDVTLSKIENDEVDPHPNTLQAILVQLNEAI